MNLRKVQVSVAATTVVIAGVALFGSQGCTVTLGDGDASFDGSFQDTGTSVDRLLDCYGCLFDQCTGQWAACEADTACRDIYTCAVKESCAKDPECVQRCYDARPAGQALYYSLAYCDLAGICTTCSPKCSSIRNEQQCANPPRPDGGAADSGTPDSAAPDGTAPDSSAPDAAAPDAGSGPIESPQQLACTVCTGQLCATEKAACGEGSDCALYSNCIDTCALDSTVDTVQCLEGCEAAFEEGVAAANALGTCHRTKCGAVCGYN